MITNINLIGDATEVKVDRMAAAEFAKPLKVGDLMPGGAPPEHIIEIELTDELTLVLEDWQAVELADLLVAALANRPADS